MERADTRNGGRRCEGRGDGIEVAGLGKRWLPRKLLAS